MAVHRKQKLYLLIFCLASITQGMYSTYFVSILTTIERVYQIQSKTAGAIISASEVGQILGSFLIAHYGGRGNKPKWIAACMALTAIAALISTWPHFLLHQPTLSSSIDLKTTAVPSTNVTPPSTRMTSIGEAPHFSRLHEQLCVRNGSSSKIELQTLQDSTPAHAALGASPESLIVTSYLGIAIVTFILCLLVIGFGSTAITTLGIPLIDDIVGKEESPLYLGLTIGLRILGPAFGFLLGSLCIHLNAHQFSSLWLGPFIISGLQLLLAIPISLLSHWCRSTRTRHRKNPLKDESTSDLEDITYQAAEDHDLGGSRDFSDAGRRHTASCIAAQAICTSVIEVNLDRASNLTCFAEIAPQGSNWLDANGSKKVDNLMTVTPYLTKFADNLALDYPLITHDSSSHYGLESEVKVPEQSVLSSSSSLTSSATTTSESSTSSTCSTTAASSSSTDISSATSTSFSSTGPTSSMSLSKGKKAELVSKTMDLPESLLRLMKNRLLLLRTLSSILHILPIAGYYTFLPKYLSEHFRVTPSNASAISGLAGILFVGIGAFLGGTVVRVFNVNSRLMTRWIATSALTYALGMLLLMQQGCPQNKLVHSSPECCKCPLDAYNPVCSNGVTYLSPCLAGCHNFSITNENQLLYGDCGCVSHTNSANSTDSQHGTLADDLRALTRELTKNVSNEATGLTYGGSSFTQAIGGYCTLDCNNLRWYVILFSLITIVHASCEVGATMFTLRCVSSHDRALAMGYVTFACSLFGTIPCSMLYGWLVDLACVSWEHSLVDGPMRLSRDSGVSNLGREGACRAYESDSFRINLHSATATVMLMAFFIDCLISSRAEEVDFYGSVPPRAHKHRTGRANRHHRRRVIDDDGTAIEKLNKSMETI